MGLDACLLCTGGPVFGIGKHRKIPAGLQDGILELRAKVGSNISRVMYFFYDGKKAVLTHGFIKKTQKTPKKEIDRAIRYKEEYFSRKERKTK